MVWLALPNIQTRLQDWAQVDWDTTIENVNEMLAYTLQFIPIVRAVNVALNRMSDDKLFAAVNRLAQNPFDWNLIRFGSASLRDAMWLQAIEGITFVPRRFKRPLEKKFDASLRTDTAPRAACAGFWLLHYEEPQIASQVFALVRNLPNGEELYQIAFLLANASECKDARAIANWVSVSRWLMFPHDEPLRPAVLATLKRLRSIANEAGTAIKTASKLERSAAFGRAGGEVVRLINEVESTCPHPEREIVQKIAAQWRDVLALAAEQAGQIAIAKPVENPYVIGNPVVGDQFVGREDILGELEAKWSNIAQPASVVLYGHRRMGKSSILQNLGRYRFGAHTRVAYVNMQRVGRVEHTGELLYEIAIELWRATEKPVFSEKTGFSGFSEPSLDDYRQNWYATFNRFLRALNEQRNGNRFILAIDEFELIEQLIAEGKVERALLDYVRGIIQTESWLIVVLAGLHTLK